MQDESSIQLVKAEADYQQGRQFALYLDTAADGYFRFMLGKNYEDILARAFLQTGHDLSWQNVMFAELDGRKVGMICTYSAAQHHAASREVLPDAAGKWHIRMRLISLIFAPMFRIMDTLRDEDFYLLAIAVDSELRGKGIGSVLLAEVERQARAAGARWLALDADAGNTGAIKLYQRIGFIIDSTWPKYLRLPMLTLHRMRKPLQD